MPDGVSPDTSQSTVPANVGLHLNEPIPEQQVTTPPAQETAPISASAEIPQVSPRTAASVSAPEAPQNQSQIGTKDSAIDKIRAKIRALTGGNKPPQPQPTSS